MGLKENLYLKFDEFTKKLLCGKVTGEYAISSYFTANVPYGIKYGIINFTSRETLIDIYMKEDDINLIKIIREVLGKLTSEEVDKILFSAEDNIKEKDAFYFAVSFADASTILKYIEKAQNLNYSDIECLANRLLDVEISMEIANKLLCSKYLDLFSYFEIIDILISKSSIFTLIECLFEKPEFFTESQLEKMKSKILSSEDITEEAASFILSFESLNELSIVAIKNASKRDILNFYPNITDTRVLNECFSALIKKYQSDTDIL